VIIVCEAALLLNKQAVGKRPPQYAPAPCDLDLWPWKWCPSRMLCGLPQCQF